jgi:tetratricopeptide (TPR) repeat protein
LAAELNARGLRCKAAAKYDEGRALYERALALLERGRVRNEDDIATLYHNLGGIEHARRNFAAGEVFARRSLAIRTGLDGADPHAIAADMVALAAILDGQERYGEAEPLYLEALRVFERSPRANAGEIAVALNDLGALYAQRGRYEQAVDLLERAAALKRRTLGPGNPDVAVTLNNLAVTYTRRARVRPGGGDVCGGERHLRAITRLRSPEGDHLPGQRGAIHRGGQRDSALATRARWSP